MSGAQPWRGDTPGPRGAGAARGIAGSAASAGRGAGRGRHLPPRLGLLPAAAPLPPLLGST